MYVKFEEGEYEDKKEDEKENENEENIKLGLFFCSLKYIKINIVSK